ncbi:DUF3108 domain-containing protein [Aromatoleum toluclasticum]|uniref:DUF3108 domain-containing protein n=1 Tax=Aromatoleum toluclasticum TaxID=92003 RepID=UPI001D18C646|nr:DUF3108 domain-containing protein [Aromatoleum toluclasticum]MCC4118016.1 DUF3108 domain-containing protein [Aromatoleum toluclasticum]
MTESSPAPSPVLSRPLLLGIALSLALHLAVLIGPQVDLSPLPDLQRLDVTLVRTAPQVAVSESPPPAPPPARKKPPRPQAEPKTAQASITDKPLAQPETAPEPVAASEPPPEPEPAPEALAEPAPESAADTAAPATESAATAEAAQAAEATSVAGSGGQAWPRAGRITYMALMGEKQFPMGKATHQWEVAGDGSDGSYRISELVEPTAVAALPWFRPGRKLRESTGRLTETGLRPERFTEREDGRPGEVVAELDRTAGELRGAGTTETLPDNAQDILSLLYQLGYPGAAAGGTLPVTAGGALRSFQLETIGEETVHLPFGEGWRTRHVRARYGSAREMTDVWLATDHFGLPVLIRTIDAKGVVYYLVATEVLVSRDAMPSAAR